MKYNVIPKDETIKKVVSAITPRSVTTYVADTGRDALGKIRELIPHGAEVMTGSSVTLEQIGFIDLLKSGAHPWRNVTERVVAEKDPLKQGRLRKEATLSQHFLGSVHAITEDGEVIIASNTGSQIPSYAFSAENVIWVAGAQKIVLNLEAGIRRIKEYVVPLEDAHMKSIGYPGTNLSKMLMFFKEVSKERKINLILIKEVLGF